MPGLCVESFNMKFDYQLIDSGNGLKFEQFGNNSLVRIEKQAHWQPQDKNWQPDACINQESKNNLCEWIIEDKWRKPWEITYGPLRFELRLSQSKNIGIFPEQEKNWQWIYDIIKTKANKSARPKILNLFAYTGAATLVAAHAGAEVCHVDASKSAVNWAKINAGLSGFHEKPIRWIVDDALKFLNREIKRKVFYDGIILDPPPFGRTERGTFAFNKHALTLLELCQQVLAKDALFLLFNCYAMNMTPDLTKKVVKQVFTIPKLEAGELSLIEKSNRETIPCSVFVRFNKR